MEGMDSAMRPDFKAGDVLVTERNPDWEPIDEKGLASLPKKGEETAMARLLWAVEIGVPAIVGAANATAPTWKWSGT